MKRPLVECVSDSLWRSSIDVLKYRVERMKEDFRCDETEVSWDEDGIKKSPCTTNLWMKDVGIEHDHQTCYFRHWFKMVDGQLMTCRFSHLAIMKLVRACVWQALLAEHVTGRLAGRHAVRLRVEDELENYSNLDNRDMAREAGMLAQDMFGLVKNHLNSTWRPLTEVALASAERLVVNLAGYDCRSKRKGWSNRRLRRKVVQDMVDAGIGDLPSRGEQEAFVHRWLSSYDVLKHDAVKSALRSLRQYYNTETGEVALKPWSREELGSMRREARMESDSDRLMSRVSEINRKQAAGERLTGYERKFKCTHKDLFLPETGQNLPISEKFSHKTVQNVSNSSNSCRNKSVTSQAAICNRKQELQNVVCEVTLKGKAMKGNERQIPQYSSLGERDATDLRGVTEGGKA